MRALTDWEHFRDQVVIVAGRNASPLHAARVIRFDGEFSTALGAFQNAQEEPVLFVVDAADPAALTTIGKARAGGVVTQSLVHRSALGPLGRTILTRIAAALAPQTDPGTVLAVLDAVEAQCRTFVLVDSPARLHRPEPSLWQHAWGLLPGTCFLGELGGRVTAISRKGLPPALADALRSPGSVFYTAMPDGVSAVRRTALDRILEAVGPRQHVPEQADAARAAAWWGPARAVELCAVPHDLAVIAEAIRSSSTSCPWCGSTAVGASCAVCGCAQGTRTPVPSTPEGQRA